MNRYLQAVASVAFALGLFVSSAQAKLPDFTGLVENVSPAVVNVSATRTVEAAARAGLPQREDEEPEGIPEGIPEELRRFFGNPAQPRIPRDRTSAARADAHAGSILG